MTHQHGTNLVILTGHVDADIELQATDDGLDYVDFEIVTTLPLPADTHSADHATPNPTRVAALRNTARSLAPLGKGSLLTIYATLVAMDFERDGTSFRYSQVLAYDFDVLHAKKPSPAATTPSHQRTRA